MANNSFCGVVSIFKRKTREKIYFNFVAKFQTMKGLFTAFLVLASLTAFSQQHPSSALGFPPDSSQIYLVGSDTSGPYEARGNWLDSNTVATWLGVPSPSLTGLGQWNYRNTTTPPTNDGRIHFNNATLGVLCTKMYVRDVNGSGTDLEALLLNIAEGTILWIPNADDAGQYMIVTTTGAAIDQTDYVEFDIDAKAFVGTPWSSNTDVALVVSGGGGGGGGSNTNVANSDLTFDANHETDLLGYDWTIPMTGGQSILSTFGGLGPALRLEDDAGHGLQMFAIDGGSNAQWIAADDSLTLGVTGAEKIRLTPTSTTIFENLILDDVPESAEDKLLVMDPTGYVNYMDWSAARDSIHIENTGGIFNLNNQDETIAITRAYSDNDLTLAFNDILEGLVLATAGSNAFGSLRLEDHTDVGAYMSWLADFDNILTNERPTAIMGAQDMDLSVGSSIGVNALLFSDTDFEKVITVSTDTLRMDDNATIDFGDIDSIYSAGEGQKWIHSDNKGFTHQWNVGSSPHIFALESKTDVMGLSLAGLNYPQITFTEVDESNEWNMYMNGGNFFIDDDVDDGAIKFRDVDNVNVFNFDLASGDFTALNPVDPTESIFFNPQGGNLRVSEGSPEFQIWETDRTDVMKWKMSVSGDQLYIEPETDLLNSQTANHILNFRDYENMIAQRIFLRRNSHNQQWYDTSGIVAMEFRTDIGTEAGLVLSADNRLMIGNAATNDPAAEMHIYRDNVGFLEALRVQNGAATTDITSGVSIGFSTSTSVTNSSKKAAVTLTQEASNQRGDLVFSVDGVDDNGNVDILADEKLRIKHTGEIQIDDISITGTTESNVQVDSDGHLIFTDGIDINNFVEDQILIGAADGSIEQDANLSFDGEELTWKSATGANNQIIEGNTRSVSDNNLVMFGFDNGSSTALTQWYSTIIGLSNARSMENDFKYNTVIGRNNIQNWTTADVNYNSIFGYNQFNGSGVGSSYNTAAGYQNFKVLETGFANTAFGGLNFEFNQSGGYNFAAGYQNFRYDTTANYCVGIGYRNFSNIIDGDNNIGIGREVFYLGTAKADANIGIGYRAGYNQDGGSGNVYIGYSTGFNVSTGSDNVMIGYAAGPLSSTAVSDKLYISNAVGVPTIYGDLNNKSVAINQEDASLYTFDVNGDARIQDDLTISGNLIANVDAEIGGDLTLDAGLGDKDGDLGTAGQVLSSTGASTDWVDPTYNLYTYQTMKRTSTSSQAITSTLTAIEWDSVKLSSGSDISFDQADSTRITIEADGIYSIGAYITTSDAVGQRTQHAIEIHVNGVAVSDFRGSGYIRNSGASWDWWIMEIAAEPYLLEADDYIEIFIAQVAGTSYTTGGTATNDVLDGIHSRVWVEKRN